MTNAYSYSTNIAVTGGQCHVYQLPFFHKYRIITHSTFHCGYVLSTVTVHYTYFDIRHVKIEQPCLVQRVGLHLANLASKKRTLISCTRWPSLVCDRQYFIRIIK